MLLLSLLACLPELLPAAGTADPTLTSSDTTDTSAPTDTATDTGPPTETTTTPTDDTGTSEPTDPDDADGDGYTDDDCDDSDPSVYPGAPTLCDGRDTDCDTMLDGAGRASFHASDGTWTDLSDTFRGNGDYAFDRDGTLWFCEGNWPAQITVTAAAAVIYGRDGADLTVLDGGHETLLWLSGGALEIIDLNLANGRTEGDGGCIHATGGALTVRDVGFFDCRADGRGGALFLTGDATATLIRAYLEDNRADRGGAAYIEDGALSAEDSVFYDNRAAQGDGGAVDLLSGSLRSSVSDWLENTPIDVGLASSGLRYDFGEAASFTCDPDACY